MTAAEIWQSIVNPYRAIARELGYRQLEERFTDWKTSQTAVDLWFRDGTYMDLVGSIVTEGRPPGIAPGFNFVQLRTFVRQGNRGHEVYTAGVPDPEPRAFGYNAWFSQNILGPLFESIFKIAGRSIKLHQPGDLAIADARHREQLGARVPITRDGDPLELRWSIQDQMEQQAEDY